MGYIYIYIYCDIVYNVHWVIVIYVIQCYRSICTSIWWVMMYVSKKHVCSYVFLPLYLTYASVKSRKSRHSTVKKALTVSTHGRKSKLHWSPAKKKWSTEFLQIHHQCHLSILETIVKLIQQSNLSHICSELTNIFPTPLWEFNMAGWKIPDLDLNGGF